MVAAVMAASMVYGSFWVVRQTPKVFGLLTAALLWKEKKKTNDYERLSRLGFDIIRDMNDPTFGSREFHAICFDKEHLHSKLQFLAGVQLLLTSEEAFLLTSGMKRVVSGDRVVPVDFDKFIDVSNARLSDEAFLKNVMSKDS